MSASSLSVPASVTGSAWLRKKSASVLKSSACRAMYCFSQPLARLEQMMLISMADSSLSTWGLSTAAAPVLTGSAFSLKSDFLAPHSGHTQSSGRSAHRVPGAIPASGMPLASS